MTKQKLFIDCSDPDSLYSQDDIEIGNKEYKIIEVTEIKNEQEKKLIKEFFAFFSRDDIFPEISNSFLSIYLYSLDFREFQSRILDFKDRYHENGDGILNLILEKVDKIRSYGLKGKKRLYVGYNKERKVVDRKSKVDRRGLYYYAQDNGFQAKNQEIPTEYKNRIIKGDSEVILQQLPDNCIDIVFTSPPYNFGLGYDNHEDGTNWNDYFEKLYRVFNECIRVVKFGGRIIVNVQPLFSDYIPIHHIISNYFMSKKMIWKAEILWEKHNWNCKYTAWGSWKSPSNPYLKYTWEFLEVFCKGILKKEGENSAIDITDEEFKKFVVARWEIAPANNMKEYGHPAMFPEKLVYQALKLFSFKGDIVLDPFNGVGTTTAVAKKLSRNFLGIDISAEYCNTAEKRLGEVVINESLF